jgi:hypothetical protein
MTIPGALAASMVDLNSGQTLGVAGSAELTGSWAGRGSAVVRASMDTLGALNDEEELEELIISGSECFHLLRVMPRGHSARQVFLHVVLDRSRANLALARLDLKTVAEKTQEDIDDPPAPPRQRMPTAGDGSPSSAEFGSSRGPHDLGERGDRTPPLPRRSPSPPADPDSRPDSVALGQGTLARIPGLNTKPPDIETIRRISGALRRLQ